MIVGYRGEDTSGMILVLDKLVTLVFIEVRSDIWNK